MHTRRATANQPAQPPGHCVGALLAMAVESLARLPQATPRLEAELLLAKAGELTRTQLFAWPERLLDPAAVAQFHTLLQRRLAGEPIAYIRGSQAFWTFDLAVSPATLIPRPETELLIETALARLPAAAPLQILDAGTGSGAIAAALALERPAWTLLASDRSPAALAVAGQNFGTLGLGHIQRFVGNWLNCCADRCLDALIANPPYVAGTDPHLERGDPRFEPRPALTPGGDGLDAIRALAAASGRCLRSGGCLLCEHGHDQGAAVRALYASAGLHDIETLRDLAGHERATLGWHTPSGTGRG